MSADYADADRYDENGDEINDDEALLALVRDGAWLDAQDFPPTSWAVHGLIPQGFGLLTGPPKAGKSWAVLGIALAVAAGAPALGKVATGDPRPVLYLALEDGDARLQYRARTLLGEGAAIPPLFHEATSVEPAKVTRLLVAWLNKYGHERPLVVLDTLGKVMPPALPGEGAYQRDYRIGSTLKRIVDTHVGATLLVVHHVRKASGEDWMDSTSGTNGLNGAADFTINLHRARNEAAGIFRVTGRDVPENEYAVTCADGRWTLDGHDLAAAAEHAVSRAAQVKATANLGDTSARIVEYVNGAARPVSAKDVQEATGIERARDYLARAADAGRITKAGRGLYTAAVASVATVASVAIAPTPESPDVCQVEQLADFATHATHATPVAPTQRDEESIPCTECGEPVGPLRVAYGKDTCAACA